MTLSSVVDPFCRIISRSGLLPMITHVCLRGAALGALAVLALVFPTITVGQRAPGIPAPILVERSGGRHYAIGAEFSPLRAQLNGAAVLDIAGSGVLWDAPVDSLQVLVSFGTVPRIAGFVVRGAARWQLCELTVGDLVHRARALFGAPFEEEPDSVRWSPYDGFVLQVTHRQQRITSIALLRVH